MIRKELALKTVIIKSQGETADDANCLKDKVNDCHRNIRGEEWGGTNLPPFSENLAMVKIEH